MIKKKKKGKKWGGGFAKLFQIYTTKFLRPSYKWLIEQDSSNSSTSAPKTTNHFKDYNKHKSQYL